MASRSLRPSTGSPWRGRRPSEVQARQATALAAGAGALNEALAEELGNANLRTESALGLVPEPKKRN